MADCTHQICYSYFMLSGNYFRTVMPAIVLFLALFSHSVLGAQASGYIQSIQRETLNQEHMLSSGVYSPFGNYFAAISRNNRVRMYDSKHRLLWTYRGRGHHGTAPALSISRNEKYAFFPGYGAESSIAMVSTSNGELIQILNGHSSEIRSLILTPDNSYLISFAPGELFLWRQNGRGYTLSQKLNTGDLRISSMTVSPDGKLLALGNSSDYIKLYQVEDEHHRLIPEGELRPNSYFSNTGYLNGLAFSPDGKWLAAGVREEITIYRQDESGFQPFQIISELDDGYVYSLSFAPDGKSFFAGFGAGTVGIWRLGNLPETEAARAAEGPEGENGADAAEEGWEYQSGFSTGQEYIAGLALHPMGHSLATLSISQNGVVLWELKGISPGSLGTLSQLLMLHSGAEHPGDAQLEVLTEEKAGELLGRLGSEALAPRGMFETGDAYNLRRRDAAERAFKMVMELILEHFQAQEEDGSGDGSGGLLFPLQGRGAYNADSMIYTLPVSGTDAEVHIAPTEAEQLYMNWQEAAVRARPSRETGYEWLLLHPVQNREYPVIFERDPIMGTSSEGETRTIPRLSIDERMFMENIQASPVFPILYRSYARQPVVRMEISNKWDRPIQNLRVQAGIEGYASSEEVIGSALISPGENLDLPITINFNRQIINNQSTDSLGLTLEFSYRRGGRERQETVRIPLTRLGNNALQWDDDRKIAAYIHTSQDPLIMETSGSVLAALPRNITDMFQGNIQRAAALFEWMGSRGIVYRPDPITPYAGVSVHPGEIDFIQFARETILFRSGDCDDLSVLYASLLESASISTAFITTPGHIFLALDSGISAEHRSGFFPDPGTVIRRNGKLWIPVETTLLQEGFFRAWQKGAQQWRSAGMNDNAEFFTSEESWEIYPPGQAPQSLLSQALLSQRDSSIADTWADRQHELPSQIEDFRERQVEQLISLRSLQTPENHRELTRRGIIYARFGMNSRAASDFQEAASRGSSIEPLLHLARLASDSGDSPTALEYLREAGERQPDNPRVQLSLAAEHLLSGNTASARRAYRQLSALSPEMAERFPFLADPERGDGTEPESVQRSQSASDRRSWDSGTSPALRDYLENYWSD